MTSAISQLKCVNCSCVVQIGGSSTNTDRWMTCNECPDGEGIFDIDYDLDAVRASWQGQPLKERPLNHWRYHELLPLDSEQLPNNWLVGWTPIVETARLADELGLKQVLFKDDGRNPSGSLKDRASSVGVAHALQTGADTVACASTGNAATSLACHAALAGLKANIFVPHTAPEPKLAQLLVYGARVFAVEGTYDEAYNLCSAACEQYGWYNRNCAINPVLIEGKKTAGLEIAEQTVAWGGVPDWVAVSIGDGCTIAGIWKGLVQMQELGVIERLPKLLGVQAEGVAPVDYALEHDQLPKACEGSTIADSIDVPVPRNWRKAVNAMRDSQGKIVCVTDENLLDAIRMSGRHGMFSEPAAAAGLAGVVEAVNTGIIQSDERVLVMSTGTGLKDIRSSIRAGGKPFGIKPNLSDVESKLAEIE